MSARMTGLVLLAAALAGAALFIWSKHPAPAPLAERCWSDKACFVETILGTIRAQGLDAGYQQVIALYTQEPKFRPHCNVYSFALADALYKAYPNPEALTLTPEAVACNYALLQQYPQSLLLATGDTAAAQAFCTRAAAQLKSDVPGAEAECYRGIGRGLPFIQKGLWGNSEQLANFGTAQCKALAPNKDDYGTCLSAVFNSIGRAEIAGDFNLKINASDPVGLCNKQSDPELRSRCIGNYKITAVSLVNLEDIASSGAKLQAMLSADATTAQAAVSSLGYYWSVNHLVAGEPFAPAIQSCAQLPQSLADACIEGLSVGIVKDGEPWQQHQLLTNFCVAARAALPNMDPKHCPALQAVGYIRGFYSPAQFSAACALFKKELGLDCASLPSGYGY